MILPPAGDEMRGTCETSTRRVLIVSGSIDIRRLPPTAIDLIGEIDRSEHLDTLYSVEGRELVGRPVDVEVPSWSRVGEGEHSVANLISTWGPIVGDGATLLGAFDGDELLGLAIVDRDFEPGTAWLAFLHVSRRHRRRGVASALWDVAAGISRDAGANSMYVSATPSNSAVGFYLDRGCELADPPNPHLLAKEPEDVHFICPLA